MQKWHILAESSWNRSHTRTSESCNTGYGASRWCGRREKSVAYEPLLGKQQMINKIWAQAGMRALAEIADIYPRMTSIHDRSLFDGSFAMDFINHGDKIIYCAMYLYVGYINEATNFAESQGGGGSDTKDWRRWDRMDKTVFATSNSNSKAQVRTKNKAIDLQPQWKV